MIFSLRFIFNILIKVTDAHNFVMDAFWPFHQQANFIETKNESFLSKNRKIHAKVHRVNIDRFNSINKSLSSLLAIFSRIHELTAPEITFVKVEKLFDLKIDSCTCLKLSFLILKTIHEYSVIERHS